MQERDEYKISIKNSIGNISDFNILACFPFSSETKSMGIILRNLST